MDSCDWKIKAEIPLADEDKARFSSAKVVTTDMGKAVCFFLKEGGQQHVLLNECSGAHKKVGDNVNLEKVVMQVVGLKGKTDSLRVKITD